MRCSRRRCPIYRVSTHLSPATAKALAQLITDTLPTKEPFGSLDDSESAAHIADACQTDIGGHVEASPAMGQGNARIALWRRGIAQRDLASAPAWPCSEPRSNGTPGGGLLLLWKQLLAPNGSLELLLLRSW